MLIFLNNSLKIRAAKDWISKCRNIQKRGIKMIYGKRKHDWHTMLSRYVETNWQVIILPCTKQQYCGKAIYSKFKAISCLDIVCIRTPFGSFIPRLKPTRWRSTRFFFPSSTRWEVSLSASPSRQWGYE